MAIIDIRNARVSKYVGANGAFQIAETYKVKVDGQEQDWTRYWTVWTYATPTPEIDTIVSVVGDYSSKARQYETANGDSKITVDLSINNPIVVTDVEKAAEYVSELNRFEASLAEQADADAPF